MLDWTRIEHRVKAENLTVSDELADCLEALWEDAIHLFCNLQIQSSRDPQRLSFVQDLEELLDLAKSFSSMVDGLWSHKFHHIVLSTPLIAPRKEGETFQDLEQDLRAHLVQLEIERYYLDSNASTSKKSDFLEDIESTPENTVRICLLHAFLKAAPFRSGGEATATVQDYTRRMSHMVCNPEGLL